jgi:hypothetical protein
LESEPATVVLFESGYEERVKFTTPLRLGTVESAATQSSGRWRNNLGVTERRKMILGRCRRCWSTTSILMGGSERDKESRFAIDDGVNSQTSHWYKIAKIIGYVL